jgi:hypothetical protein
MQLKKIINDRVFHHKQQYLVKWKDFAESENSWENEDNFVNTIPIKIYWKLKDQTILMNQNKDVVKG